MFSSYRSWISSVLSCSHFYLSCCSTVHVFISLLRGVPMLQLHVHLLSLITARGSEGITVSSIVAKFILLLPFFCFSVYTITHEPLHLARWIFLWACILTNSWRQLNIKVTRPDSRICHHCERRQNLKKVRQHDNSWAASWSNFVRTCTSTTSKTMLNLKVTFCLFLCA